MAQLPNLGALDLGPPTGPIVTWDVKRQKTRLQTVQLERREGKSVCPISQEELIPGQEYYSFPGYEGTRAYEIQQIYEYARRRMNAHQPVSDPCDSDTLMPDDDWEAIAAWMNLHHPAEPVVDRNWRGWDGLTADQFEALRFWQDGASGQSVYWMEAWFNKMKHFSAAIDRIRTAGGARLRRAAFRYHTPFKDGHFEIAWVIDEHQEPADDGSGSFFQVAQNRFRVKMVVSEESYFGRELVRHVRNDQWEDRLNSLRLALLEASYWAKRIATSFPRGWSPMRQRVISSMELHFEMLNGPEPGTKQMNVFITPLVVHGAAAAQAAIQQRTATWEGLATSARANSTTSYWSVWATASKKARTPF